MKTVVPLKHFLIFLGLLFAVLFSTTVFSQIIPELVFRNSTLISGTANQDGARYRFNNVGTGLDAILEIRGRSAANVVVSSVDVTSSGWDKALQPQTGINGTVAGNQNWWVEFRLTFYNAGTNVKKTVSQFAITSLDTDGNGGSLREWIEMERVSNVGFSPINSLTDNLLGSILDLLDLNNNGEDHKITGVSSDYPGIDTAATNLMATYTYNNKNEIDFYLGGQTGSSSNSNGMRMNSLWFKQFSLNAITLPVKLVDFSAKYNKPNVELTWETSQELNFSHYELEYSSDGNSYSQKALVFGAAEHGSGAKYNYTDHNVNSNKGLIYYRMKMVDDDGKFKYSPVRIIRLGEDKQTLTLTTYPNPVLAELRVTVPSAWQGKQVVIDVYNASGQKIKSVRTTNSSQTENIPVADIVKGVYFVKAACGTEIAQQTIIKN